MEGDDFANSSQSFEALFEDVFRRLLEGEQPDLYEENISAMFEVIARYLLAETPGRKFHWYDGVIGLTATIRKQRQIEFAGKMWVGDDHGGQWLEDFRCRVTDKTVTKQGLWISLYIGEDKAEGAVSKIFGGEEGS